MRPRIAIVGAGLTGLTCARILSQAGHVPVVLDKGRGIGGRLATRRTETRFQFDYGAPFVKAETASFVSFLSDASQTGHAGLWDVGTEVAPYVGVPGMSDLPRFLIRGYEVRSSEKVLSIRVERDGVEVALQSGIETYDHVVLTVPAPQVAGVIGPDSALAERVARVIMMPILTLMAGFRGTMPTLIPAMVDLNADLAVISRDDSKQGRGGATCWVAHAGSDWSEAHLELSKNEIAQTMLPLLCDRIGASPTDAVYVAGHRWRYAQASIPLGTPCLKDQTGRLRVGGDWCLGPNAEHAWQSGTALANDLLAAL